MARSEFRELEAGICLGEVREPTARRAIAQPAWQLPSNRDAVSDGNLFKAWEVEAFDAVRDFIEQARRLRDLGFERWFQALYGGHVVAGGAEAKTGSRSATECSRFYQDQPGAP